MSDMPQEPFQDEPPLTDHQILRDLWHSMDKVLKKDLPRLQEAVDRTNGRVSALEMFRWTVTGGIIVITAVIVPMFIQMVVG